MTIPQNRRNILDFFGQARDENEARVTHEKGGREQQHEALRARLLPTLRGRKNRIFFYLNKLN